MRSNAREQEQTGITLWQLHRSKRFNHPSDQTRFIVYLRNLVRRVGGTDLWCVGARCCVDHLRCKSRTLRWNWKRVWVTPRTNVYHSHFSMYDVTWLFWFKVHNLSRIGMTLFLFVTEYSVFCSHWHSHHSVAEDLSGSITIRTEVWGVRQIS